jgi:hypothetical protein
VGFEPCVLNLIWKCCAKDPKKKEDQLIFMKFRVKKNHRNDNPKIIKTLIFELYNLVDSIEQAAVLF